MGLASPVRVQYPEPFITYTLATGGGVNPYTGLDRFGRVIDLPWFDSESTLVRLNYGYDRASNRTFRKDLVAASHDKRFSELYEYDGVQRLKKFHRGELVDGDSVITAPTLQQGWQLDATGNWVNFTQANPATPGEALDQQRAHNTVNEITDIARTVGANWITPQHDRNGNTTLLPRPNDSTDGYTTTWDAWNRMVTVSDTSGVVQTNTYDGLVRRISQATASGTERYLYTASWQTLEEHPDSPAGLKRRYLWGLRYIDDLVLQDRDPIGTGSLSERSYALQDALFNVVALSQPNALIRERFAYTAYGRPLFLDANFEPHVVQESVVDERYLFTGRRLDPATHLYYYRARYYDPELGRFLGRDPLGYVDGLGLYEFVKGGPLANVDPIGLAVPIVPIVVAASCGACWAAAGSVFNTAHRICEGSDDETGYLLCFMSVVSDVDSSLDWYTWTVINGACLACGGGLAAAGRGFAQQMAGKWAQRKAAKEAREKARKEAARKAADLPFCKCNAAELAVGKEAVRLACKTRPFSCGKPGEATPLTVEQLMSRAAIAAECAATRFAFQRKCFRKGHSQWLEHEDQRGKAKAASSICAAKAAKKQAAGH